MKFLGLAGTSEHLAPPASPTAHVCPHRRASRLVNYISLTDQLILPTPPRRQLFSYLSGLKSSPLAISLDSQSYKRSTTVVNLQLQSLTICNCNFQVIQTLSTQSRKNPIVLHFLTLTTWTSYANKFFNLYVRCSEELAKFLGI